MLKLKLTTDRRPLAIEARKKTGSEVVLEGIRHQLALLQDPGYSVERTRYAKTEDGNRERKTVNVSPRPWWWQANDGTFLVQIRYGSAGVLEIEPNKPTIVAGAAKGDVEKVLNQVAQAVKEGEMDDQIARAKEAAMRK